VAVPAMRPWRRWCAKPWRANKPLGRVLIRDGAKVHVITADKIDVIEAQDDYVQIRSEGRNYLKNQRMAELEEQLDGEQFLRIHRSYIVNIACVERIEQATRIAMAVLRDGSKVPVSRSGYQKIRAVLQ
jgi:two-component system LytT family response regulator